MGPKEELSLSAMAEVAGAYTSASKGSPAFPGTDVDMAGSVVACTKEYSSNTARIFSALQEANAFILTVGRLYFQ